MATTHFTAVQAESLEGTSYLKLTAIATASLPAASADNAGQMRLINDNGAGDDETALVISNGTAWVTADGNALD